MLKFAYIMNIPGETPQTYSAVFENEDGYNYFVGVDGTESAAALVKQLDAEGFTLIDLCGDFDDKTTEALAAIGEGRFDISHANYFPEELAKIEALPSLSEYGIIVIEEGVSAPAPLWIKSESCNTSISLVRDLDMACEAAKELVQRGVYFIELCSWFDAEKTKTVIDAIKGQIPVGSCGI